MCQDLFLFLFILCDIYIIIIQCDLIEKRGANNFVEENIQFIKILYYLFIYNGLYEYS